MDHGSNDHDGDEEHAIHLPDPSLWPLIVGFASLFLGLALVWWSQDREDNIAGPLLGAATVFTLVSAAGWAWEDARMRRKAESGESSEPRNARYTQVITFAISEGAISTARQATGVLGALEAADTRVRNLAGFQDLRIITTPAAAGPSQVLVETTWSDREHLSSYEESRRTILDVVAGRDEVVPGSLQVFDMEVVRDTKDVAFRFGLGSAVTLLGGLIVAGLMIGAGLTIFAEESVASEAVPTEDPGSAPVDPLNQTVVGRDNTFDKKTLTAPPQTEITINFENRGRIPHNIHFLTARGGTTLAPGAEGEIIDGGASEPLKFTTPGPGNYFYRCDVHPDQMTGTLTVQ